MKLETNNTIFNFGLYVFEEYLFYMKNDNLNEIHIFYREDS